MTAQTQPTELPIANPPKAPLIRKPQWTFRQLYLLLVAISAVLMVLVGPPTSTLILIGMIAFSVAVFAYERRKPTAISIHLDLTGVLTSVRLRYAIEIGALLLILLAGTQNLQNWSVDDRVRGGEFSYLINSGVIAANIYHKTGAIPLWNPFMGHGEPLVENPFSFVLNPLMTLPIFWFGAITGTKLAILLHIGIIGIGGWFLGLILGLKTPARLFLGLLLGASGSMVGAIGMGFYQVGLSQAYVPWVYAGLLGTIYRPKQRSMVGVLVVAATLMIFAGTFWYVLTTAIGCALLVLFHTFHRDGATGKWRIDTPMLGRMVFAGVLLIGLTMIRLLPQAVNNAYIDHPLEFLDHGADDLLNILRLYVSNGSPPPYDVESLFYHYIMPLGLIVFLAAGRLVIGVLRLPIVPRWRVVIPGLMLILFFSSWAQGGTPFMLWLYNTFTFLQEWRFVTRILAAATPWIVIIGAIWFDNMVSVLWDNAKLPSPGLLKRWHGSPYLVSAMAGAALLALVAVVGYAGIDVLKNWDNAAGTEPNTFLERDPLYYLRAKDPNGFISVETAGFYGYLPFYETYTRATFGNPDYHAVGVDPTIGTRDMMNILPAYATAPGGDQYPGFLNVNGYHVTPESNPLFGWDLLWQKPDAINYMFTAHVSDLDGRTEPLTQDLTQPVTTFVHNIDEIEATVDNSQDGVVLVAQEEAYPGWQVTVNGQPAPLESVGGMIGVRLPAAPATIVFSYRPTWLYIGALISLISFVFFVLYLLRVDRVFRREKPLAAPAAQASAATNSIEAPALPVSSEPAAKVVETAAAMPVSEKLREAVPTSAQPKLAEAQTAAPTQAQAATQSSQRWMYVSTAITLVSVVGFALYALRMERLLKRDD